MTIDTDDPAMEQARLQTARRELGKQLAWYRQAAGFSQPQLGQILSRTRNMLSKIEHGIRAMPASDWKIADDRCNAKGALIAEHAALVEAERDYRGRCRQARQAAAQAEIAAARTRPAARPEWALVGGEQAKELVAVVARLIRLVGRRKALQMAGLTLAMMELPGLDTDEHTRMALAVAAPGRVDAQVVENLAISFARTKRLEDGLGPCEVLDSVVAQHGIVRRLLADGQPPRLHQALAALDSHMATTIGGYLVNIGHLDRAGRCFDHARRAGHDAGHPTFAAYAAASTSFAAYVRGDTPAALDTAAATRSLAVRTDDVQLKALAELRAAGAYALDGQQGSCLAALARAEQLLNDGTAAPGSPVYWVHEGTVGSQRSMYLSQLGRPREAVNAASTALIGYNNGYVRRHAHCQVRLGHALVLTREIDEATPGARRRGRLREPLPPADRRAPHRPHPPAALDHHPRRHHPRRPTPRPRTRPSPPSTAPQPARIGTHPATTGRWRDEQMEERPSWVPTDLDLTHPSVARVYDYYLGGSHNFEADREFARRTLAVMPDLPTIAHENRAFLRRVVQQLCAAGIDQFLDLGSGIPTVGNAHEVAQQANPQARVVYVDHEPVAVTHSQQLLADDDQTTVLSADLRDPGTLLADPVVRAHLDLERPVAVLLVGVLHVVPNDDQPAAFVAEYMRATVPGSYLVISHLSRDGREDIAKALEIYNQPGSPSSVYLRSREEITALFGDLTIVEPGVVRMPQWRPDSPDDVPPEVAAYPGFAGVGRRDRPGEGLLRQ